MQGKSGIYINVFTFTNWIIANTVRLAKTPTTDPSFLLLFYKNTANLICAVYTTSTIFD